MLFFEKYIIRLFPQWGEKPHCALRQLLGFRPRNYALYEQALSHTSSNNRSHRDASYNNERLEFLGDAILGSIVAHIVYKRFPGKREGFLTESRSNLVKRSTLGKLALQIGLDRMIKVKGVGRQTYHNFVYGNAFEALVGAIYLDRGYDCCYRFIEKQVMNHLIDLDKEACEEQNYKSRLLEWSQQEHRPVDFVLFAQVNNKKGPVFYSRVLSEGIIWGEGSGYSKRESQQMASRLALQRIKKGKILPFNPTAPAGAPLSHTSSAETDSGSQSNDTILN